MHAAILWIRHRHASKWFQVKLSQAVVNEQSLHPCCAYLCKIKTANPAKNYNLFVATLCPIYPSVIYVKMHNFALDYDIGNTVEDCSGYHRGPRPEYRLFDVVLDGQLFRGQSNMHYVCTTPMGRPGLMYVNHYQQRMRRCVWHHQRPSKLKNPQAREIVKVVDIT